MSFKEKIIEQLGKLDLIPKKHTPNKNHLFADYFELISLFSCDEVSQNDIIQEYKRENIKIHKLARGDSQIGSLASELDDKEELWADEIFSICNVRDDMLQQKYPFLITGKTIKLKDRLSDENKIYILLLLASNLNYFPDFQSFLTSDFEQVSFQSLKKFLPGNSIVKQLGKHSDLNGTAKEKIKELAGFMNIRMDEGEIDNNVQGNQERGLDLIGWIPFQDKIPNLVSILGQCACGNDWYKKQGETRRYENAYFRFYKNPPIHTMFIPYALGKSTTSFFQSDEVDCFLFERFRIMEYIGDTGFFNELQTKEIIDECIAYSFL